MGVDLKNVFCMLKLIIVTYLKKSVERLNSTLCVSLIPNSVLLSFLEDSVSPSEITAICCNVSSFVLLIPTTEGRLLSPFKHGSIIICI